MTDSIAANIARNAAALKEMQEEHGVMVHDTPEDLYPSFLQSSAAVMEKYSAADPLLQQGGRVPEGVREADRPPYWTKLLGLYHVVGHGGRRIGPESPAP